MNKVAIAAIFAISSTAVIAGPERDPRDPGIDVYSVVDAGSMMGNQPEIGSRVEADLFAGEESANTRVIGDPASKQ